jgi:uncharacterized membrane protein YbhN (UPF0104 family)
MTASRRLLSGPVIFSAKLCVSLLLLGFLAHQLDLKAVFANFSRASLPLVLVTLVLSFTIATLHAWRWQQIVHTLSMPFRFAEAVRLSFIGLFFNQTLPSSIGGDLVRVWMLHRAKNPLAMSIHSVLIDRASALAVVVFMCAVALPVLLKMLGHSLAVQAVAIIVAGAFVAPLVLLLVSRISTPRWLVKLLSPACNFLFVVLGILGQRAALLRIFGAALLSQLGLCLVVVGLAQAIAVDFTIADSLLLVPAMLLLSQVPISIAGWGVREASAVTLMGAVGIAPEDAFTLSALFGLNLVIIGIPGAFLWLRRKASVGAPVDSGSFEPLPEAEARRHTA